MGGMGLTITISATFGLEEKLCLYKKPICNSFKTWPCILWYSSHGEVGVCVSSWIWESWWLPWPKEYDGSDTLSLLRLAHKRPCSFYLPHHSYSEAVILEGSHTGTLAQSPSWVQSYSHLLSSSRCQMCNWGHLPAEYSRMITRNTIWKMNHSAEPNPNSWLTQSWDIIKWWLF